MSLHCTAHCSLQFYYLFFFLLPFVFCSLSHFISKLGVSLVNVLKFIFIFTFTQIPPDGSLSSCSPHLNALPLTYCLLFLLDRRAEKAVGGREKEESHVQAQVLDEQGDRHRRAQRTSELSMVARYIWQDVATVESVWV